MLSRSALSRPAAAKRRGFTLLELIVVLLILGILAAIAIPTFNRIQGNSVKSSAETDARAIARNADGIAASENNGIVNAFAINTAAGEAYGGDSTAPDGDQTDSKTVTAAVAGQPANGVDTVATGLTIAYTSGSITCTWEVDQDTATRKAIVTFVPGGNCPE